MAPLRSLLGKIFEKLEQSTRPNVPALYLDMLEEALRIPLPAELAVSPPRPDVWGTRGYLVQPRYAAISKPLLLRGQVTRGIVYEYECSADGDGCDATARYAWFAAPGQLRTERVRESYDGLHAVHGHNKGFETKSILLDMEARLNLGRVLTLVHDGSQHVVFEALRTDFQAGTMQGPDPTNDLEQLFGRYVLEWKEEGDAPALHLSFQEPIVNLTRLTPVCHLRPDDAKKGAWQLFRAEQPWLRILPIRRRGAATTWNVVTETGETVGQAEKQGEQLVVTQRGTSLRLSMDGKGGWTAESDKGLQRLSCAPAAPGKGHVLQLQGSFQVSIEALLLALAAAGRPWSLAS